MKKKSKPSNKQTIAHGEYLSYNTTVVCDTLINYRNRNTVTKIKGGKEGNSQTVPTKNG